MSGAGRKGSYRKGVTDDVINGTPEPEEGELVAKVKAPRGGNIIEIICKDGVTEGLAVLPQKFRKLVWVKRGDFVIVSGAEKDIEVTGGGSGGTQAAVKFRVTHVLYKEQIRHLKAKALWPAVFDVFPADVPQSKNAAARSVSTEGGLFPPPPPTKGSEGCSQSFLPSPGPLSTNQPSLDMHVLGSGLDPESLLESSAHVDGEEAQQGQTQEVGSDNENEEEESDFESEESDFEDDIPVNTNRRNHRAVAESSSEEESEEDD
mmetsp:Transcript_35754/g.72868  ORF Transcript_35754/g.72868 Transcript_35754/m.72868 type:complete len:262 (-) Transcript_35754:144-929(-)